MGSSSKFLTLPILMLLLHGMLEENQIVGCKEGKKIVVNVDDFSAVGDGVADDSEAFLKAWNKTCSSSSSVEFLVPDNKKYLLRQLNFTGPCKSHVTFLVKGTIEASMNLSNWNNKNRKLWIVFDSIRKLRVRGGGIINGNGHVWWQNSCKINKTLALRFISCKHLRVENLRIQNSQKFHVVIENTTKVEISKLSIRAPQKSPNTDGIHLDHARNVVIRDCDIRTGDDCISVWAGSKNIKIHKIFCGPGHGISIGSLGKNKSEDHVKNVLVDMATLNGTTNGVRIKSWQGGRGYAKHITFQNIAMHNVTNPIIIDQFYCDATTPCHEQRDAVKIKHIFYKNIRGTSASDVSMRFNCSRTAPCRGIKLQNINLVRENGTSTRSTCNNVHWTRRGIVAPIPCGRDQKARNSFLIRTENRIFLNSSFV